MGKKPLTYAQINSRLPDHVKLDFNTWNGVNHKARFIDSEYGEWWALPYSVFRGHGNPKRGRKQQEKTNLERYGNICTLNGSEIKKKAQATLMSNYGVENPFQSEIIKNRIKETSLEKYGTESPSQSAIIKAKFKKTCTKKFGTTSPILDPAIMKKSAKSMNKMYECIHWKTNEVLFCRGSYEYKTVLWLNKNKIDFAWQPLCFITKSNKVYHPDLFLISDNRWVEIKGWFKDDARDKWDEFIAIYTNTELWDTKRLKELGVL